MGKESRSEQIMVRLRPEIKQRFQELCQAKGMTMSTMAAFLVGDYVQKNTDGNSDER